MPLIESPPDALAETYARGLFELAEAGGGRDLIEEILDEIENILELARTDATFSEFLASRVLPVVKRRASLDAIFSGRIQDLTLRFLQVLNAKGRLSHLPAIVGAFDALVQERFGRVEVDLYTASPISSEELDAIKTRLQEALDREPIVHPYTDNTMLGGIKLQIGDQLIDGSLATRLRQMRELLAAGGTSAIRQKAERILDDAGQ